MPHLFLLFLCSALSRCSMSLKQGTLYEHSQTSQEQLNYLQGLINLHEQMKASIESISQIHSKAKETLKIVEGQSNLEISVIENTFRTEKNIIFQIQKDLDLPVELKTWECKNLTQTQIDNQNQQISAIQTQISEVNKTIQELGRCQKHDELRLNLDFLSAHIENLKEEGSNTCDPPKPQPKKTKNISNLESNSNWIYNKTTETQYLASIESLKEEYELTLCPSSFPFIIDGECSQCPQVAKADQNEESSKGQESLSENQSTSDTDATITLNIYDLSQQKCAQCPEDSSLIQHKCVKLQSKYKIANLKAVQSDSSLRWIYGEYTPQNYEDEIKGLNETLSIEFCPDSNPFPFENSTRCGRCDSDLNKSQEQDTSKEENEDQKKIIYDLTKKACVECPQHSEYVSRTHQCAKIVYLPLLESDNWIYGTLDQESYQKRVNVLRTLNVVKTCPRETPFPSESFGCMSCPEELLYNIDTKKCTKCTQKQSFNNSLHKCQNLIVECSTDKPYWTGERCIKCQTPGAFNEELKLCECPQDFSYNASTGNCVHKDEVPVILLNSDANVTNYKGKMPEKNPDLMTCGTNTPYFNGTACVGCFLPKYFNFQTLGCESCGQKMRFDIDTKGCIVFTPFSEKYNSYIGPQNKNYCCRKEGDLEKIDANLKTCDVSTPYFDGSNCIQCPSPTKFFNFTSLKCEECPENQTYSIGSQECTTREENVIYQSNLAADVLNYRGETDHIDISELPTSDQNGNEVDLIVITCSLSKPYWNGVQCIECNLPSYFNFETKLCESCPEGEMFDILTKNCLRITEDSIQD